MHYFGIFFQKAILRKNGRKLAWTFYATDHLAWGYFIITPTVQYILDTDSTKINRPEHNIRMH